VTDNNVAILGRVHVKFNGARTILQCLAMANSVDDGPRRSRLVGKGNDASSAPKDYSRARVAPRETR